MTSVSYEEIFSYFLGNITDYNMASLDISDANELMVEYLHKSLAEPYVRRLFSSLSYDDEIQNLSFEMDYVVDESSDRDFVIYILSKNMVCKWLEPFVRKTSLINQHITSSSESKFYSQSQHISELRAMLDDTKNEVRSAIRDRGYIYNSYLETT